MESIELDLKDQPVEEVTELQDERSYECMFCKNGFTTAQALGGHMNVHRKDRAKINGRPNSLNNKSYLQPCLITSCSLDHHQEGQIHDFMSSSSRIIYEKDQRKYQNPNGLITCPSGEELSLRLSLQFGWSREEESVQGGSEEDELDLELRLG